MQVPLGDTLQASPGVPEAPDLYQQTVARVGALRDMAAGLARSGGDLIGKITGAFDQAARDHRDQLILARELQNSPVSHEIRAYGQELEDQMLTPEKVAEGFAGPGSIASKPVLLGLRAGELSPTGSHFATRGSSTYFDLGNPDVGRYNLAKVNILDTSNPQEALPVLKDVAKHPLVQGMKGNDPMGVRDMLATALRDARVGQNPVVDYLGGGVAPFPEVAKKHGFGGYKFWENDDIADPSTVFAWDLNKVVPHGAVAKQTMQDFKKAP